MSHEGLVKKIGFVGIVDIFIRLKAFIFIPIISKMFGVSDYGVWAQIMVTVTMFLPVAILGIDFGFLRYLPGRKNDEIKNEVSSALFIALVTSIICASILIAISKFLSVNFFGGGEYSKIIKMGGLYLFTICMRDLFLSYFRARERFYFYSLAVFAEAILSILLAIITILLGYDINTMLAAIVFLNFILVIVLFIALYNDIGISFPLFLKIKRYLAYSLPFVPMMWLLWVINSSDRYFLGHFRTTKEVGIYSACYGVSYFVVNLIVGPLYLVLEPRITNYWNNSEYALALKLTNNLIRYIIIIMFPSAIGFIIIARQIIIQFTSPEFVSGVITIPFILLGYIFFLIAICIQIIVYLSSGSRKTLFIYFITAILNTIFNYLLIPVIGMLGAAIATMSSFFIFLLLTVVLSHKDIILNIDIAFLLKSLIAALLMGILINKIPNKSFLHTLLIIICGAAIYMYMAYLFRIFGTSELKIIKKFLR